MLICSAGMVHPLRMTNYELQNKIRATTQHFTNGPRIAGQDVSPLQSEIDLDALPIKV